LQQGKKSTSYQAKRTPLAQNKGKNSGEKEKGRLVGLVYDDQLERLIDEHLANRQNWAAGV